MNKMHFYCFIPFCQRISLISRIIHDLLLLSCCHRMTQMKRIYPSSYHSCHSMMTFSASSVFLLSSNESNETNFSYSYHSCHSMITLVAHPGTRTWCHALPWWAVCCSLSSRTAAASKQKILRL